MLRLSTKARYGSRAMVELALANPHEPMSVKELAEALEISAKYLEHILSKLRTAGLVQSYRGVRGGFVLARDPEDVSLKEVLEAIEGPLTLVDCVECERSESQRRCRTHGTWREVEAAIGEVLARTTVQSLTGR